MAGLFSPSALVRAFGGYTSCEVCAVFARLTSGWLRMGYAQQIDGMVHQTQTQKEISTHFLSFSSFFAVNIGAAERIRTSDLLITNQLLYQLSYNSMSRAAGITAQNY